MRLQQAAAEAPPLGQASFGKGVKVYSWQPTWAPIDAVVTPADRLYVIFEPYDPHQPRAPESLGAVVHGKLTVIDTPAAYSTIAFEGDEGIIVGSSPGAAARSCLKVESFAVRPTSCPPSSPNSMSRYFTLLDGGACRDGSVGSGVALYEVDKGGKQSPLLSVAAMRAASGGLLDVASGVRCFHFHGSNYAVVDTANIILRIADGKAQRVTDAKVMALGDDRLLLQSSGYRLLEADVESTR